MANRKYYSQRKGERISYKDFRILLESVYKDFEEKGYFNEAFGFECVDAGKIYGYLGKNIDNYFLKTLRKGNLWPLEFYCSQYTDEDAFDVIELLYDLVSKPVGGTYHEFAECGWHYDSYDKKEGQNQFRNEINNILKDYKDGYEITKEGEVVNISEIGMGEIFEASVPKTSNDEGVNNRIQLAIAKYRSRNGSTDDRKEAVRDLIDVLEYLRPEVAKVISQKDDDDLFNIANNFSIRHYDKKQKDNYEKVIWLSWTFYAVLATIHAGLRLIEKDKEGGES